jgi:small subunit ribosomal protein S9
MPRKKKTEAGKEEITAAAEAKTKVAAAAGKTEKKKKRTKKKVAIVSIRRKESVARAIIMEGKGIIRVNNLLIGAIQNPYAREIIYEPIRMAGDRVNNLEILVSIKGGGVIGQAQAARTAIAKGIVAFTKDDELRAIYLDYDRFLLVPDPRRVEPKKFKGRKARARFQKSYR